jgi:hypothetical protein
VGYAGQSLSVLGEDAALRSSLIEVAGELEYAAKFRNEVGASPSPLRELQAPLVTISGTTYPYRHTLQDSFDKVNQENLRAVGRVLERWLEAGAPF